MKVALIALILLAGCASKIKQPLAKELNLAPQLKQCKVINYLIARKCVEDLNEMRDSKCT